MAYYISHAQFQVPVVTNLINVYVYYSIDIRNGDKFNIAQYLVAVYWCSSTVEKE